jgi:iron complex outermembrane receptor protein
MTTPLLLRTGRALAAFAFLLLAAPAFAQTATLEGLVTDAETGRAVPGVNVVLDGAARTYGAATDAEGRYRIDDLPAGTYAATARAVGYTSEEASVTLTADAVATLDFALRPATLDIDAVVVSATRSEEALRTIPASVTVLGPAEIETQQTITSDLGAILAQAVPGLAPSSGTLSNYGQTLRGRDISVLIDGVPQNTPLRNASRWLRTIDPTAIERVEVVRGASALYGYGATGGTVNFITKGAEAESFSATTQVGTRFSPAEVGESFSGRLLQQVAGRTGRVSYLASGSYEQRGYAFDGEGDMIPQDPQGQGGIAHSEEVNVLGKVGYALTEDQHVDVAVNYYDVKQDLEYSTVAGTVGDIKATAEEGDVPGDDTGTRNVVAWLGYGHDDVLGSRLRARAYVQDYETIFGFYAGHPDGGGQGYVDTQKAGARLDVETPLDVLPSGQIVWGLDLLLDQTAQPLLDGRTYVPEMTQMSAAPFVQLKTLLADRVLLRGGLRYERIRLDVDSYTTLYVTEEVKGGELDYDALLASAGAVVYLTDAAEAFASFGQGYSVSDVGRVLRSPMEGFTSVEQLHPEAMKVDQYEVGLRGGAFGVKAELAGFLSTSDLGATYSDLPELRIVRSPERVWGVEAAAEVRPLPELGVGGTVTWLEGKRDADDDGEYETYLSGDRIPPLKLTGFVTYAPTPRLRTRLQVLYSGARDRFPESTAFAQGAVESYTTVDLATAFDVGSGTIELGVENLFDTFYFPTVSQWYNYGTGYAAAPGREVSLTYTLRF